MPRHIGWSSYAVSFENQEIWNDKGFGDCKRVVSAFPPTTLGRFGDCPPSYELKYKQGVSFEFEIENRETLEALQDRHDHPTDYKGYSPALRMISVISGSDDAPPKQMIEVFPNEGIRIHKPDQTRVFIELGCGLQSLVSCLGLPDSVYGDNVFNYFRFGIDVKMSGTGARRITQIVLHTNLPGVANFGRYERAWFQFDHKRKKARGGSDVQLNNLSKLPELIEALGDPGPPIVIDDPSVDSRHFYSFPSGTLMEISQSGFISSVHLSISR